MIQLIKKILRPLKRKIETNFEYWLASKQPLVIYNINKNVLRKQKKILISYSCGTFYRNFSKNIRHSNIIEINQIIAYFIAKDFILDIIDCTNQNAEKLLNIDEYDYVLGFGEPFKIVSTLSSKIVSILYLTENIPSIAVRKFEERKQYFNQRTGKRNYGISRVNGYFTMEQFRLADFCISLNRNASYKDIPFYYIVPAGLINLNFSYEDKNFDKAKTNFIWFGSAGAIHKGLDILIDVFKLNSNLTLHVCGLDKHEKSILGNFPSNVVDYGHVDVGSERYIELINTCAFTILPSCSEGMSTSIMTGMLHGLIPVVTKECNIDVSGQGYFLDDFKVEYINNMIKKIASSSSVNLLELSRNSYEYSRNNYTLQAFTIHIEAILDQIFIRK